MTKFPMEHADLPDKAAMYRHNAEAVRERAQTCLPEGRKKLLDIAEEWERMADEEVRYQTFARGT